jgi:hypothetical protein
MQRVTPIVARTALRLAIGALFALALALVGCGQPSPSTGNVSVPTPAGPPLHIGGIAERVSFNTPARMCGDRLTAVGTVSGYGAAYWDTPDGTRPSFLTPAVVEQQGYAIYTPLRFSAFQVLNDNRHLPTREFAMVGGQVGQDTYSMDGFPRPPMGQRDVMVFVDTTRVGQPGYSQETLGLYQEFLVDSHGTVWLQHTDVEQGQVVGQNVTIALADLTAQLATCPKE